MTVSAKFALSAVALAAGLAFAIPAGWLPSVGSLAGAAFAQDDGSGGGEGHQGGQGNGGQGARNGQGTSDGKGQGQGGPSEDSEGKGPRAGSSSGSGGGKPVWAQEGIPEVELGRLNVARSPDRVLNQAYDEAIASITPEMLSFYNMDLEAAVEQLSLNFATTAYIDSPLQNLALLRDALDGSSALADLGVSNDIGTLQAIFIGVASDKTLPISVDTVVALTTILGAPVTGDAALELATDAEAVRIAVLAGHG